VSDRSLTSFLSPKPEERRRETGSGGREKAERNGKRPKGEEGSNFFRALPD
jgi:hypothetical protein